LRAGPLPGARPVVFAGPGAVEAEMARPVLAALPGAIDLAGRLSLPEAAACLARMNLFVGNDSGLMHLAAAAGAPTLGLFGPSPADEYAPSGRRAGFVVAPGPAGAAPMAALTVAAAAAAAMALLQDNQGSAAA
jgi:ADP-heptose:LPS heptosyltransferase